MKTSAVLSLLLIALAPRLVQAQTISGVVLEEPSRMPVAGATVAVLQVVGGNDSRSVRTDSLGAFHLALGARGRFTLRITHPSYMTVESDTLEVNDDETVTLELRMERDAIPLKPLVVTARVDTRLRGFHERAQRRGFGRFVTREDIDRRPGLRPSELLQGVAGVQLLPVAPCRGCAAANVVYLRGGADKCVATILIDGVALKQDAALPIDALLMSDMLEGVEVYTDVATIPPAFGGVSGSCGVVAFWTRTPEGGTLTWKRLAVTGAILVLWIWLLR